MKVRRVTPVLLVDRVEPSVDFFKRLGFTASIEIREGSGLGFALLENGAAQVMVETRDNPRESHTLRAVTRMSVAAQIFIEVEDLDAIIDVLRGEPIPSTGTAPSTARTRSPIRSRAAI